MSGKLIAAPIHEEELVASYETTVVPHQLHPRTLLTLARELYGGHTRGVLLSIKGHDFDFGEGLSAKTAALVPEAVTRALTLATDGEIVYNQ